MTAAATGALDEAEGIGEQVQRMLQDDRAKALATDFADAWLELQLRLPRAAASAKDKGIFPTYTDAVSQSLLRGFSQFIEDSLVGENGGVRKLLTSRAGWVDKSTASIFGTDTSSSELARVDLDEGKRRGLLTQPALMAAFANTRKQSPIHRGVMVMESVLCQEPPPPPDGMVPQQPAPDTTVKRTTRERLVEEHESQGGTCKSCHQVIDGIGFAFENYDAIGKWQDTEDGLNIDSSGRISDSYDADGTFPGAVAMIDALAGSEQVAQCFVENFYRYALARNVDEADGCNIAYLTDRVLNSESDLQALIEGLTSTPAFRFRSEF